MHQQERPFHHENLKTDPISTARDKKYQKKHQKTQNGGDGLDTLTIKPPTTRFFDPGFSTFSPISEKNTPKIVRGVAIALIVPEKTLQNDGILIVKKEG
jgi:hypothetical protein